MVPQKKVFLNRWPLRFFFFVSARFVGLYTAESLLRTELTCLSGAGSLSRSAHCAPDENDSSSEQAISVIFNLPSVYTVSLFLFTLVSSLEQILGSVS